MFDASGNFVPEYQILDESNTNLVVIEQPTSDLGAQPRSKARSAAQEYSYPLLVRQSFSTLFPSVQGSNVTEAVNVYSSRSQFTYRTRTILRGDVVYKNTEAPQIFSFLASCDSTQTCREKTESPVILIHGFTPSGLGGDEGTWGKLPVALIDAGHPVFEMQWVTYMRFEEAAGTLANFGKAVAALTGKKPLIIAHSFGGIVAHLALQEQGIEFDGRVWKSVSITPANVFSQLITLDSPLSGISDSVQLNKVVAANPANNTIKSFTKGRDSSDLTINGCASITCLQAGAFDMNPIERGSFQLNVSRIDSAKNSIFPGESIARLQSRNTAVPFLTVVGIHRRPFLNYSPYVTASTVYKLGDELISLMGQAYNPDDFANDAYNVQNDFQIRFLRNDDELRLYEIMDPGECGQHIHLVGSGQARAYWICIAAAHTTSAIHRSMATDYSIAYYEDPLSDTPAFGGKYYHHPLKKLISDTNRIAKPATPYDPNLTVGTTSMTNGAAGVSVYSGPHRQDSSSPSLS